MVWGVMASPIFMQAMWLLLASAASVSLDTRSVQQEFPMLANVIYSICGMTDIDFSVSHPCAFSLFGMAYAFTECGVAHSADFQNFQTCVDGCSHNINCGFACNDPEVKNPECLPQCNVVAMCIEKVAGDSRSVGQHSVENNLRECFETEMLPTQKAVETAPTFTLAAGPAPAMAAASPAPQAAAGHLPMLSIPAPAPAHALSHAPAPGPAGLAGGWTPLNVKTSSFGLVPSHGPDFSIRQNLIREPSVVPPACRCSMTGVVRGVTTGSPGCSKFKKEKNAHVEAYCYVEGGFECGGAMPSALFPGLFWVGCEKPNFELLFPPTCEIIKRPPQLFSPELFSIGGTNLKVPPSSFEAGRKNMQPLPVEPSPLTDLAKSLSAPEPLPPLWHAQREHYFGASSSLQASSSARLRGVQEH
jgi:hypothetical protein